MRNNPNATAGTAGGAVGIIIIAILEGVGVDVDPILAAAISTVTAGIVLLLGRAFFSKFPGIAPPQESQQGTTLHKP